MSVDVKLDKKLWADIVKRISEPVDLRVGILGTAATAPHDAKSKAKARRRATIVQIAATHEFGDRKRGIPMRSFLRAGIRSKQGELKNFILRLARNIAIGKIDIKQAHELLGIWGATTVKNYVKLGAYLKPALKPATIARKKSSRPLVDTGQLINAVSYDLNGIAGKVL